MSTKVISKLGIMQGRLVPPEPERFQAFPRERWASEFGFAKLVPLSYIEWIYDLYGADVNPILGDLGKIQDMIRATAVEVRALCADYFMDLPFLRCSESECAEREEVLRRLLHAARGLGIRRVVLPFVDASRIETPEDRSRVVGVLKHALPVAIETGVELHLETALGPKDFAELLDQIPSPMVKVNYDSGNSSSLGFKPAEEFAAYGERIGSIHIKDRVRGGGTVPLGTGDTDFQAVFDGMEKSRYEGDITLQVARSQPRDEVSWTQSNRQFVAQYWPVE
jgi:L-ribulose-5-phosphate 3-epimerase